MKSLRLPLPLLVALHGAIVFARFLAPSDSVVQNRDLSYAPPSKLHWKDDSGKFHLRPFLYGVKPSADGDAYVEDHSERYAIRFFLRSKQENGHPSALHLFGVDQPGHIFLLGTDEFGRDLFSRIIYGGRISIAAGLFATLIALGFGIALGAIAGMAGGVIDSG